MKNTSQIRDIPESATITLTIQSDEHPRAGGVFQFRLLKGSPIRQLLEVQEIFEEGYDAWRTDASR